MSSFKKLRLDPETNPQGPVPGPSNQPGANLRESLGGTFPENSSYSGYPSGNTSFRRSSGGPFRTRYSRPVDVHSGGSNSFSRFSPYFFGKDRRTSLKVPIIRARRDESDLEGLRPSSRLSLNSSVGGDSSTTSATSSTAQKIIETLQNLSTPVLNAGKIRIDQDIKAVQPLSFMSGGSFSRTSPGAAANRSIGPPKMCSSLLLSNPSPANQISPILNTGDQRRLFYIPKMIDAATNTDKQIEVSSPIGVHGTNKGPEMKSAAPLGKTAPATSTSLMPASDLAASKDDNNSDDEFHECSSEFVFSSAWSPEVFDRYFANEMEDKSTQNKSAVAVPSQPPPLLNGFKDSTTSMPFSKPVTTSSTSSVLSTPSEKPSTTLSSKPATSTFAGFQPSGTGSFGFGISPLKDTFSQATKPDAVISADKQTDQLKPTASSGTLGKSPLTASSDTSSVSASSSFKFGSSASSGITTTTDKAEPTKATFTFGSPSSKPNEPSQQKSALTSSLDKVDAKSESPITLPSGSFLGTKSPLAPPPLTVKNTGTKWRCPACMVENEINCQACVCCSEKNPNASTASAAKPVAKKWRCPTCMIENELEAPVCVCCTEKNPNAVAVIKKWRCTTCMVENEATASACVCCSEKNPNAKVEQKDLGQTGAQPQATAFKFGISSSVSGSISSNNTFSFGQPASTSESSFKFGASTTSISTASLTSSTVSQPVATSTPFKFGVSSTSTPSTQPPSTQIPSFGISSPAPTSSQPVPTTNTTTTTASSSVFGEAKPVPETITPNVTTSSTSIFGAGSFQSPTSNSFSFAASSATSGDTPKPASTFGFGGSSASAGETLKPPSTFGYSAPPVTASEIPKPFSFGASANSKPAFNTFSFGGSTQNPGTTTTPTPSLMPAAPITAPTSSFGSNSGGFSFGSSNPSAPSPFGQTPTPSGPTNQPPPAFQFGGSAPLNPSPAPTPGPNSTFNITPNINFGAVTPGITIPFGNPTQPTPTAGSQPPPALFQFNATNASDSPGGRQIKKAVRRFKK
ncbi:unnamed protein product [Orchesella dallaii]|uniref:Nuclear pore complex protein Nup153 n=1 Tax=Orchesella dallaii TaxID=48710 RepID=A0ABP1QAC6_9HEXA